MAYIILPSRRTRQPQGAVRVDPRYGLKSPVVFCGRVDDWTNNGAVFGTYSWGRGLNTSGGGGAPLTKAIPTGARPSVTFVAVASKTANRAYSSIAHLGGFSLINGDGAGNTLCIQKDGVNALSGLSTSLNTPTVFVGSHRVSTGEYYLLSRPLYGGSVLRASSTNTQAAIVGTSAAINANGTPNHWDGAIGLVVASLDWLPESLGNELLFNPFQILAPDTRRIYIGAGATGGGNITFEALPSSLSLAGSLANLWANRLLTANPASFTFAGATASTLASRKVLANPSTLTMTGATGTLKWNRVFVASPGTLGFTGSVANFLLGKILTANPGSLNLTGATATVKKNSFIIADPGALSFVGQAAGLFRGRIMTADPGSLTLSGAVASLFHFRVLPADPGTLALTGATATLAAPGTVQRARPSSDISSNGWLPSSGADLYAMLDETSYNDSDYIYSPDNPTTQAAEVKFSAITDPGVNTGHVLRFRLAAVGQDTVFDVYLMCGATQIATWQKTVTAGVTTTYSETLTVGEAGNITDYSDLRIKVVAHA